MAASASSRPMESRTGRVKQRYSPKGERLVAGVVPLSADKSYVLMIQSTRRKGWVLPKGGWELDEECPEAAAREAWEEAGILVTIDYDLGDIQETNPRKKQSSSGKSKPKEIALYRFYEATVNSEELEWPEKEKRERKWFTYAEAYEQLKDRPELQAALQRSTMKR
ncbi:putative diphosphoinositol polyphosphate phosphohydrolase [Triangularia verruculosa]|uniref:Diphosphoinositol polyphosphate phosphohydrolase n=1 Tax=Triangularia verruculosa TaxID=2587418 RepID=A0AAN7AWU3_9PEZI|nr:putative diphosphoinositol polyphosphate phosphohydrolase [Triangularia verruculosa]